jgi:hypothetical protein
MPFDPDQPSEVVDAGIQPVGFDPDQPSEVVNQASLSAMQGPPRYGTEMGPPTPRERTLDQWRRIRETLSPLLGDTAEQAAGRIEGLGQRGLLAPRPAIPIPRMGQQEGTVAQVGAGLANAGAGLVEGLQQPLLLMTGTALPGAVNAAVSAYFAGDMASHVPEGVRRMVAAAKEGRLQEAVEAGAGVLGSAFFAKLAAKHAVEAAPLPDHPGAVVARDIAEEANVGPQGLPDERAELLARLAPIEAAATVQDAEVYQAREAAPWLARAAAQARGFGPGPEPTIPLEAEAIPGSARQPLAEPPQAPAGQAPTEESAPVPAPVAELAAVELPGFDPSKPSEAVATKPNAETITVPDERVGSEMAAEREERPTTASAPPPPSARTKRKYGRADADRPPDIIDEIESTIGKIDPKLIEEARPDWKPRGAIRQIMRRGGIPADVALSALVRHEGLGAGLDPAKVDSLIDAIEGAHTARKAWRAKFYEDERQVDLEGRQTQQFEEKVVAGERPKTQAENVERVPVESLIEGDTFKVQDHTFWVAATEFDQDGNLVSVTVKDGPKFGVQRVGPDQAEFLHIDKGTYEPAAREDFLSPEELAKEPEPAPTTPGFFEKPETIEEQQAREADLAAQEERRRQKSKLEDLTQKPLTGSTGDIGQSGLFDEPEGDIFAGPSAEAQARKRGTPGARGYTAAAGYPGGPLGTGPANPANNPKFTQFPVDLPEAVEFYRQLTGGQYPKVVEAIRRRPDALGVFRYDEATGRIELRADTADLLTPAEKAKLREEANDWGQQHGRTPEEAAIIAQRRYEDLLRDAYEEAKQHPPLMALKVLWHEIGHLVDWLPDHAIEGRGNLFGHIAALKGYLEHTLPLDAKTPPRPITAAERAKLHREAEKQMKAELGPIIDIVRDIVVEEPIYGQLQITPDDVKAVLGMDAREKMPELYKWFATQPRATQVEVLKAAMRGMLDQRLATVQGTVQTGTRKVWRTVREKSGREPTKAEVRARFEALLQKEMKARRTVELAKVKAELEPLIAWWRGTAKMEGYFKEPSEMYAEAFSVFLNNPAAMAARAPITYGLFHGWLDARPEVKETFERIQDSISAGTVARERVLRLRDSWRRDAEASVEKWREQQKTAKADIYDNILYHVDRRFGPVYRVAKDTKSEGALMGAVGNFRYRAAEHERFLAHVNERVGGKLLAHNLDMADLGELLFHQRVINERHNLYNPGGWHPKASIDRLREMQTQLGPARWQALTSAGFEFRSIYAEQVIPLMKAARLWNQKLQDKIDENVNYATFAAVRGLPDKGIEREIELAYGSNVTPHIYTQIGMLGEVRNPATATVLKALSLISAAHRNIAKREIVRTLSRETPGEIIPAESRWAGDRREFKIVNTKRVGTIVLLEDGAPKAFYVRKVQADAINGGAALDSRLHGAVTSSLNWQKALFTALNYGFWPVNFVRDTLGFMAVMPGHLGQLATHWLRNAPTAWEAARASARGDVKNPIADALLRRQMVVSREDPRGVYGNVSDLYDVKLASFGMDPKLWDAEAQGVHAAMRLWHKYLAVGQAVERFTKAQGMTYLDKNFSNLPEWKQREIVRSRAGSPDFLDRGASNATIDFFGLFFNPWKQGMRAWASSVAEHPWQFAGKMAAMVGVPTAAMAMGAAGAFGEDTKRKFRSVPDYDMSNYFVIPIAWDDEARGKVLYFRLPLPDPMRIMHAALFKAFSGRGSAWGNIFGGQLPSLNPVFQSLLAIGQYTFGGVNPTDLHTGRHVIDDTTFAAGGWPATKQLSEWTVNQLGGGIIGRFRNQPLSAPKDTAVQAFLAAPVIQNAVGRWIKSSNGGLFDADREASAEIEQLRAKQRQAVEVLARRWADAGLLDTASAAIRGGQGPALRRQILETQMSKSERVLLRDPYALEHLQRVLPGLMKSRSSLLQERLQRMPSAASKADLLRRERERTKARP